MRKRVEDLNSWGTSEIVRIILAIAECTKHSGLMLNERYLHHYFSYSVQIRAVDALNFMEEGRKVVLHPEWPTYKKQAGLFYGQYRKENGKYVPNSKGTAGFIDFAIGDYEKPEIGLEFSLKYGWSNEEIVYDFLKLLDVKNPFKTSISLNIIFRKEKLARGRSLEDLKNHINGAYKEAVRRLGKQVCAPESRDLHLIVTEIAQDNNRRHWHYEKGQNRFETGLPQLL